jgi:hypothetical protein
MPLTTLGAAKRALARSFDDMAVHTITSATTTTVTAATLIDATANASANRFDGAYVHAVATGQVRRVKTAGYVPGTGVLTLNTTWTDPADATQIEVTRLLPPASDQLPSEEQSWAECIRRGAAKLLIPDRLTPPIGVGVETISLIAWTWLDRPERLLRVLEPPATGTTPVSSEWRGWRWVLNGGAPALEMRVPFAATAGALILEVLRPADTLISGVETAPGTGPTLDTQTLNVGIEELVVLGTLEAATALMSRNPGRPGQWEGRYKEARERSEQLFHFDGAFYKPRAAASTAEVAA